MAQLVAHIFGKDEVIGSTPIISTINAINKSAFKDLFL